MLRINRYTKILPEKIPRVNFPPFKKVNIPFWNTNSKSDLVNTFLNDLKNSTIYIKENSKEIIDEISNISWNLKY